MCVCVCVCVCGVKGDILLHTCQFHWMMIDMTSHTCTDKFFRNHCDHTERGEAMLRMKDLFLGYAFVHTYMYVLVMLRSVCAHA